MTHEATIMSRYYLGVDIGGTHISCAPVDTDTGEIFHDRVYTTEVDSNGSKPVLFVNDKVFPLMVAFTIFLKEI